jgi:regulator of RNase E activity RraA
MGRAGDVAVFDNGARADVSVIGGLSATWAKRVGIAACIVDGGVRDVGTIRRLHHPVWSRGRTPITGRHRLEAVEINGTVRIGNVQVRPGDLVAADETGVCVIPRSHIQLVLERCLSGEAAEAQVIALLEKGAAMSQVLAVLSADKW